MEEDPFSDLLAAIDKAQKTTKPDDQNEEEDGTFKDSDYEPAERSVSPSVSENNQDKSTDEHVCEIEIENGEIVSEKIRLTREESSSISSKHDDKLLPDDLLQDSSDVIIEDEELEELSEVDEVSLLRIDSDEEQGPLSSTNTTPEKYLTSKSENESAKSDKELVIADSVENGPEEESCLEEMFTIENHPDDKEDDQTFGSPNMADDNATDEEHSSSKAPSEHSDGAVVVDIDNEESDFEDKMEDMEFQITNNHDEDEAEDDSSERSLVINETEGLSHEPIRHPEHSNQDIIQIKEDGESNHEDSVMGNDPSPESTDVSNRSSPNQESETVVDLTEEEDEDENIAKSHSTSTQRNKNTVVPLNKPRSRSNEKNDLESSSSSSSSSLVLKKSKGGGSKSQRASRNGNVLENISKPQSLDNNHVNRIVVEPGRQSETVSMVSTVEPMNLAIQSVRGNAADFHVIENTSPVVPVVIQPQPQSCDPLPLRAGMGKRKLVNLRSNHGSHSPKIQRFSGPIAPGRVMNIVPLRGPPLMETRKGRPPVRGSTVRLPYNYMPQPLQPNYLRPQPNYNLVTRTRAPQATVLSRMRIPFSVSQPPNVAGNLQQIQVIRQQSFPPGQMTSILPPTSVAGTVTQANVSQPKLYTILIPTTLPNKAPMLATVSAPNTVAQPLRIPLITAAPPPLSSNAHGTLTSTSGSIASGSMPGTLPASILPLDPKLDDNWLYVSSCNLVETRVIPEPPANLKLQQVKRFACEVCGDEFISRESHTAHLNRQSARLTFNCKVCSTSLSATNKCQLHIGYKWHRQSGCNASPLLDNCTVAPLPASLMPDVYKEKLSSIASDALKAKDAAAKQGAHEEHSPAPSKTVSDEVNLPRQKLTYQCPECSITFTSKSSLAKHFVPRSTKNLIQCKKCLMLLHSTCAFWAHMRIHGKEAPFVCPECGMEVFGPRRVFLKHIKQRCMHFTRTSSFPCPKCDAGFPMKTQVQSHIVSVHADIYHKCSICPMAYKSMPSFQEHNLGNHTGQGAPQTICKCPLCDTVYNGENELTTHIGTHLNDISCKGKSTFKCLACPFMNEKKKNVMTHMNRSHSTMIIMKEMCYVCGIEGTAADIQIHTYNVHKEEYPKIYKHSGTNLTIIEEDGDEDGIEGAEQDREGDAESVRSETAVVDDLESNPDVSASPKWECIRCDKVFENESIFKKHMAKHRFIERKKKAGLATVPPSILKVPKVVKKEFTKQVPSAPSPIPRFPCAECDAAFFVDIDLAEHMKTKHNLNSQFPCHLCGLTYPEKYQLENHHTKVHQGKAKDFSFVCASCLELDVRKGFHSRGSLMHHLTLDHKIKKGTSEMNKHIRDSSIAARSLDVETLPSPDKGAANPESPVKRLRVEGEDSFVCAKCGFTAQNRADFSEHIDKHQNVDESAVQCRECGLSFAVQMSLKRHLLMVHKVRNFKDYLKETGIDLERPQEEIEISRVMGSRVGLQKSRTNGVQRQRSISSSRASSTDREEDDKNEGTPIECTVCYKTFTSRGTMHSHMRTHGMAFIRSKHRALEDDVMPN